MVVTNYVSTGIAVSLGTLDAQLVDVNQGDETAETIDVTHQASTSKWREFKVGLLDAGTWTLTLAFDPDAVVVATGTADQTLAITWPTGATKKYSATVHVTGTGVAAPLGQKMVQNFAVKVTGAPDWAAV